MYCSHCGAELPEGSAFCSNCGAPVQAPTPAPVVEEVAPIVEEVAPIVEEAAPVVEQVEEAPAAVEAVVEPVVDDVEAALERLKAEMAAAGEIPAEVAAPVAEAVEPIIEPEPELAPVIEPEPVAIPEPELAPVVEPEPVAVPEPAPAPEPAPTYTPVVPVSAPAEPATYVETAAPVAPVAPVQPAAVNPTYSEPTTISAPYTPAETSYTAPAQQTYTPAPTQSYTAPTQAYTAPAQQSYTPPSPVNTQPAGYAYQPAATSVAPAATPAKKSPVGKIVIAVVALALVGTILFLLFGRGGGNNGGGSNGGGTTPIVSPTDSGSYLDSKGNPTLYAITELDGSDLVYYIEEEGFEWDGDAKWWISEDGNDAFYISGNNDYEYIRSEITGLDVFGKGDSCVYVIVVDDRDYNSLEDAFSKLANIKVIDTYWVDDELGLGYVESSSGTQSIVLMDTDTDIGLYILNVFNEEAISSGLLEEYLGDDYGDTAAEVWSNLNDGSDPIDAPSADFDVFDSKGNLTLCAIMELDGGELVFNLENKGFEWDDDVKWWAAEKGENYVYLYGTDDYEYLRNEVSGFSANAKGDPCQFVVVVDSSDYSSAQDAFNSLANVDVLDSQWTDMIGIAVVESPSGTRNIVAVTDGSEQNIYYFAVFNEDALKAGMFDDYAGDDFGDTVEEVWENLVGRSI